MNIAQLAVFWTTVTERERRPVNISQSWQFAWPNKEIEIHRRRIYSKNFQDAREKNRKKTRGSTSFAEILNHAGLQAGSSRVLEKLGL